MQGDTVATRLRYARQRRAMTQAALSAATGVTEAAISKIENGASLRPQMGTMRKLAAALGVEPGWLLTGDESLRPHGAA